MLTIATEQCHPDGQYCHYEAVGTIAESKVRIRIRVDRGHPSQCNATGEIWDKPRKKWNVVAALMYPEMHSPVCRNEEPWHEVRPSDFAVDRAALTAMLAFLIAP